MTQSANQLWLPFVEAIQIPNLVANAAGEPTEEAKVRISKPIDAACDKNLEKVGLKIKRAK